MKKPKPHDNKYITPDSVPLTGIQAQRLSSLTGIHIDELQREPISKLADKLKWRVKPELFWFRRICGRVVKKDPATGIDYPVPFAKVYVEDTDCNLLWFFPVESPWSWFWPLHCTREVIGQTTTDACGHFCVWIPRFEIDWILRWRLERYCYGDIFKKPSIRDILIREVVAGPVVPPRPGPDPGPESLLKDKMASRRVEQLLGPQTARKLAALQGGAAFGGRTAQTSELLDQPAFTSPLPPPIPAKLNEIHQSHGMRGVAAHLNIAEEHLSKASLDRYIGPFWRCYDVLVPQFVPIFDVPDITFRVTQDVDGDGDEETIYSEGYFDVRWDAGDIPDVTLHASEIAVATVSCLTPDVDCSEQGIRFAGLMPLVNPYLDTVSGFALRPNKPRPGGLFASPQAVPANAPFTQVLQFYGCNHYPGASFYRILYAFNGSPAVPFLGFSWPVYPWPAGTPAHWVVPDAAGWYPILPDGVWFPDHLLLEWPTGQSGTYQLSLEFGDGTKNHLHTTPSVPVRVDNSDLSASFTELRWRPAGGAWSPPMELICPVVHRPVVSGVPVNIEFSVSYAAATEHLRSVQVSGSGCGGGNPTLQSALATAEHWHTGPLDNSVANTAIFGLSGGLPQGAYNFTILVVSRAFNPAGSDGGHLADWNYDPVYRYQWAYLPIAVVNS